MLLSNVDAKSLVEEGENDDPQDEEREVSKHVSNNLLNKHYNVLEGVDEDDDVHDSDDHTKNDINMNNGNCNLVSHIILLVFKIIGVIR